MSKSPILVTGITGFVGSYLGALLIQKGKKVRAIRRPNSRMDLVGDFESQVEWVDGDLLDVHFLEEAVDGVEQVFHCAAHLSFQKKDVHQMHKINVEGTANLVNAALDAGVKKLLHVSSIAALGKDEKTTHRTAESQWKDSPNNTQYAISKYKGELEAWRGSAEGLEVNVVLPAVVIGAGFWNENTARFFEKINNGLKFYPTGSTGFVDVRDVVSAMYLLMESGLKNQRLLLCSENCTYHEFFQNIAAAINKTPPTIKAAPWMAEMMWRWSWVWEMLTGKRPMITKETARMSMKKQTFDGSVAPRILDGFVYRSLDETIESAGKIYLEHQNTGVFKRS